MLIAVGVGGVVGYAAAVVYAVVNSLNKTLLFLSVEVRGWLVGAVFAVGAFSVAGVPPAAGFFGKVELFRAGIDADRPSRRAPARAAPATRSYERYQRMVFP